jgi:hypothetical protein
MSEQRHHRTKNLTGTEFCAYCEQGADGSGPVETHTWVDRHGNRQKARIGPGLVIVSYRTAPTGYQIPEYGPCPHCEAGAAAEDKNWPRGYWQGRPADLPRPRQTIEYTRGHADEFVDLPPGATVELSPRENHMRTQLLTLRYNGVIVDPAIGIDIRSGERRRQLVERELAKGRA